MKNCIRLFFLLLLLLLTNNKSFAKTDQAEPMDIVVDQIGYLPNSEKIAILILNKKANPPNASFELKNLESKKAAYAKKIDPHIIYDKNSRDFVVKLDFSDLKDKGKYCITIGSAAESFPFKINENVYGYLFHNVMRGFYFQRCGAELQKKYAGKWARKACHLQDAIILESNVHLKSIGGWHDAGDYGKKIVPGAVTSGILLKLYELFPSKMSNINLDIPKKNLPDVLSEIKYELDWMLTMQRQDGGVYHLLATKSFPPIGTMPQNDVMRRYIVPVSSAATADFAAVMAMASRIYSEFDPYFSEETLMAAERAWKYLEMHSEIAPPGGYHDPKDFTHTGAYEDESDLDERFWAAVELLKTTKNHRYEEYIEKVYKNWNPTVAYPFSWKDMHAFAMFEYMTIDKKTTSVIVKNKIKKDFIIYADNIVNRIMKNGYNTALDSMDYYWGSNGVALSYSIVLIMANEINPNSLYIDAALNQLHYVLGRNSLNMSFVSGMGSVSPQNPLHLPSIGEAIRQPIPGLLVGGPDALGDDPYIFKQIQRYHLPPAKSYLDNYYSYSTNEVSIYWNALLAFVSGYFLPMNKDY